MKREAGGYQYLDEKLNVIHTTSVPMNDREAVEYISIVEVWFHTIKPKYILRREIDGDEYTTMLPYEYNAETKEVTRIGAQEPGAISEG